MTATQAEIDAANVYERLFVPAELLEQAEDVLRPYRAAAGEVHFDSPAHIVTATKV